MMKKMYMFPQCKIKMSKLLKINTYLKKMNFKLKVAPKNRKISKKSILL
jgi:hypothetical protein